MIGRAVVACATLALVLVASTSGAVLAADVEVVDGDTLRLDGARIRLWGIDAPELHQACPDRWLAGVEATRYMRQLVEHRSVACDDRGHDRYGRMISLCQADGQDLGAAMVRAGMAWAFVRYSSHYVDLEAAARAGRLGVHGHDCEPAWTWRADHQAAGR